jgi:hypothetical protein
MALADALYVHLDWHGEYFSGHPIDGGWMLGGILLAIAASVARDVFLLTNHRGTLRPSTPVGSP